MSKVATEELALGAIVGEGQPCVSREVYLPKQVLTGQVIAVKRTNVLEAM